MSTTTTPRRAATGGELRKLPKFSRSKWGTGAAHGGRAVSAATDGYGFEHRGLNFETYRPVGFGPDGETIVYGWSVFWEIDSESREEITGGWGDRAPAVRAALDEIDARAERNAAYQEAHPGMVPERGRCCEHLDARHAPGRYGRTRCRVRGCGCAMYRRGPVTELNADDVRRDVVLALYSTHRGAFELPVSGVGVRRTDGGGRVLHVCDSSGTIRADLAPGSSVFALAHTVPDTPRPPAAPKAARVPECAAVSARERREAVMTDHKRQAAPEPAGMIECQGRGHFFVSGDCEGSVPLAYGVEHPAPELGDPDELKVCAACVRSYMEQSPADYADESAGETIEDVEPGAFFDTVTAAGERTAAGGFDARGNRVSEVRFTVAYDGPSDGERYVSPAYARADADVIAGFLDAMGFASVSVERAAS